jgi:hypothetical protein
MRKGFKVDDFVVVDLSVGNVCFDLIAIPRVQKDETRGKGWGFDAIIVASRSSRPATLNPATLCSSYTPTICL